MKEIAVEKGLSNISDYLRKSGYKVSEFDAGQKNNKDFVRGFDAIVLSGLDDNVLGVEIKETKAPVILASGMKPEDVKKRIETYKM